MFQFTAFARESRDYRLFVNSPELFADFHAHYSHLMPRHPPYALNSLATLIERSTLMGWINQTPQRVTNNCSELLCRQLAKADGE